MHSHLARQTQTAETNMPATWQRLKTFKYKWLKKAFNDRYYAQVSFAAQAARGRRCDAERVETRLQNACTHTAW